MTYTVTKKNFSLMAQVIPVGQDLCVIVTGGTAHIGSISTAIPYPNLDTSSSHRSILSTFCMAGHKDNQISAHFSATLAERLGKNVTVLCGIHYDNASPQDIQMLLSLSTELLDVLCGEKGGVVDQHSVSENQIES